MKTKVLMVCLGNICRSPLAEGILKAKVDPQKVFVDSAGTAGYHVGELPDPRSIEVARKHGIDITDQRCRKFSIHDFENFDRIYVMDNSNLINVSRVAHTEEHRKKAMRILDVLDPNAHSEVPDPYYGGDQGFENVYQMLDEACTIIAQELDR